MKKITHIDCFSGPGGICTGLKAARFQTLVAIEYIKSCVETYTANHPEVHTIHSDIRDVTADMIIPYIPKEGVDLVTSGMPCETFSTAGNTSRSFYDDRQFLFREGLRIATISNAKFILFENVPAITTKKLIVDVLKKELVDAGYSNYIEVVLDATNYGVPQKRKRYFILATRIQGLKLSPPPETCDKPITVEEAFAGLPKVSANSTLERFSLLKQGESLKDLFDKYQGEEREKLQAERILPKRMFIKRNYKLILKEPAPTVTSHCLDEFVHPIQNRALTVRECARLQSFPDFYNFAGGPYLVPHIDRTVQDKYEQIGDAVPPLLAYAWGKQIAEIFKQLGD